MPINASDLAIAAAAAATVALVSLRAKFLAPSGAAAAFLLGTIVTGFGGIAWCAPLITFFLLSSLLSRFGPKRRRALDRELAGVVEKGSTRDAMQVLANGGVAGLVVLAHAIHPDARFLVAYAGALAAAAADTWGTEIGVLSRGATISLRTSRRVAAGMSGGVSLAGTAGAAAGACSVAASAVAMGLRWEMLAVVAAVGMAGMIADSLAGAVLQVRFRCAVCGAETERGRHCDRPTIRSGGYRWITNDVVNILCCLVGAGVAWLGSLLVGG